VGSRATSVARGGDVGGVTGHERSEGPGSSCGSQTTSDSECERVHFTRSGTGGTACMRAGANWMAKGDYVQPPSQTHTHTPSHPKSTIHICPPHHRSPDPLFMLKLKESLANTPGILQDAKCPRRRSSNMGRFLPICSQDERELSIRDPRSRRFPRGRG